MDRKKTPIADRILAKVANDDGECWIFTGCKLASGYGKVSSGVRNKPVFAHRAMFSALIGPIPDGSLVLHRCDRPSCVNPSHLFLGSAKDNWDDARAKGRNFSTPQETPNYRYVNHYLKSKVDFYASGKT